MSGIALSSDGKVLTDGAGGLCLSCCPAAIAATSPEAFGYPNHGGLDYSGNVLYKTATSSINTHQVILTEDTIYYAQENGVARHTRGSLFIDKLTSLHCRGIDVDADGNIYIAHDRSGGVSVTKLDSSGGVVWTYDTGADAISIRLNYDETKVVVTGIKSTYLLWVLATSDATPLLEYVGGAYFLCRDACFDIAGNIYYIPTSFSPTAPVVKITGGGGYIWGYGGMNRRRIITDNEYVYFVSYPNLGEINEATHQLTAVTVALHPTDPNVPDTLWNRTARGGSWVTVAPEGELFTCSLAGNVFQIDPSNGDIIWETTGILPSGIASISVIGKPGAVAWACANNYIVGDIRTHNNNIYEANINHLSCDDPLQPDEPGVGVDWESYWDAV